MSDLTRRRFLHTSVLGAAALGAAAALPGCSSAGTDSASAALAATGTATGTATGSVPTPTFSAPLVAVIRDFNTGEIAVYQGNREVRYHDQNVLQSIIKAAS